MFFNGLLLCGAIVTINSLYRTDEIGDGEEDKTIEPFAGLHKAEEHKITVTAIYFEWFTFLVTHMIILNNDNISYILLNLIEINVA